MPDTSIQNFDLKALLRLGDLDIREIAEENLTLTVGNYNSLLSKFMDDGPAAAEALAKISTLTADENNYQTVIDIKTQLEDIGCNKLMLILSDIITAIKKDNLDLAADCTKSILDDFDKIYSRIASTVKIDTLTDTLASEDQVYEVKKPPLPAQFLKNALEKLEREEADRKLRILVVDDSAPMIETIFSILSEQYKVYGLTDPMMLETFLQQIVPELFLLDYKMPRRSGFELIPIIRSFAEHKDTPIIILTSMGTIEHISAAHSLGACDFIVKPVHDFVLHEKIEKHIVKKKLF